MYIVDEKLPKDCFECKFRTRCNVWESFLKLPLNMQEINIDDLDYLRPMVFSTCRLHPIPSIIQKLYMKWYMRKCMHLCLFCKHKNKCELCIMKGINHNG
ncbi:MAG: hypothetical protein J6T10_00780 [Methanobrevibacter sp.]|nr:hypothetical protein [Methanobrevibacter sp.]